MERFTIFNGKTMERFTIFNGKINDFDWAIFNSFLLTFPHDEIKGDFAAWTVIVNQRVKSEEATENLP